MYNCIVVGSGFAGATVARKIAEEIGKKVLVIDKRDHIGGNMYDYHDERGVLVHKYGPHIYHTNSKRVHDFLSDFTGWYKYEHAVLGYIDGAYVPIPFNLNTLEKTLGKKAEHIKDLLLSEFGYNSKIPIMELRLSPHNELKEVADFVYEKIFLHYTMKQWGLKPDEIDQSVTSRVPVFLSYDNRYFQDMYQGMPDKGYTALFKKMLSHPNIETELNTNCNDVLKLDLQSHEIYFRGTKFDGEVVYTGAIDELLSYMFGVLPYRSLNFEFETYEIDRYQNVGTINYPNDYDFTRITEYKHLTGQTIEGSTSIVKEYPLPYSRESEKGNIPYYPIIKEENNKMYEKYRREIDCFKNLHLVGRLAEYKYYNMDLVVERSLDLFSNIKEKII